MKPLSLGLKLLDKTNLQKYWRDYYRKNKKRIQQKGQLRKIRVLSYYSNGKPQCSCCPEDRLEFLTIHHIKGGGTKHRTIVGNIYAWIVKNNFPPGFKTMCMNCNHSLGRFGYCPHHPEKIVVGIEYVRADNLITPRLVVK